MDQVASGQVNSSAHLADQDPLHGHTILLLQVLAPLAPLVPKHAKLVLVELCYQSAA